MREAFYDETADVPQDVLTEQEKITNAEMIIFDEMTRGYGNDGHREDNEKIFLEKAYRIGFAL